MRFGFNPKEAFNKLQTVTKYSCFEKEMVQSFLKLKKEKLISALDEVNILLNNRLKFYAELKILAL